MLNFETMRQATVEAIRQTTVEIYQTVEKDALFGFAICTHDDVDSVYHVYATRQWVSEREAGYADIGFLSVEWEQQADDRHFAALSSKFWGWAIPDKNSPQPAYDVGRTTRFRALVDAMKICRDEGLFDVDTLLSVGSTNPDNIMVALDLDASRRLNTKEIAAKYRQVIDC